MNKSQMQLFSLLVISVIFLGSQIRADQYFKQVNRTEAVEMFGNTQPARADTTEMWVAAGKTYMKSSKNIVIIDSDTRMLYLINDAARSYTPVSLGTISAQIADGIEDLKGSLSDSNKMAELDKAMDNPKMDTNLAAGVKNMIAGMNNGSGAMFTVKIIPTDESKKIGKWDTRKYVIETSLPMGGKSTTMNWTTEDIKTDYEAYYLATQAFLAALPGFDEAVAEFRKMKGVTVHSETTVTMMGMSMNASTELLEYKEAEAPKGIFSIPEGYTETEMQMPGMGMGR